MTDRIPPPLATDAGTERWLEAVRRYLSDRDGRDLVAAETRRTELLIGQLLGPGVQGQHTPLSLASDKWDVPRQDRVRFRLLAEHADAVEATFGSERTQAGALALLGKITTTQEAP